MNVTVANVDLLQNFDVLRNSTVLSNILDNSVNNNKVGVGVAAQIAAQLCGTNVTVGGILGALASPVQEFTCTTAAPGGPVVTIVQ